MKNRLFFSLLLCAALLGGSLPAFSGAANDVRAQAEARRAELLARRAAQGQTPAAPLPSTAAPPPPASAPVIMSAPVTAAPTPANEPIIEKIDKLTLADVQDKLVVTPDLIWQVRDQTLLYDLQKAWEEKQNRLAGGQ